MTPDAMLLSVAAAFVFYGVVANAKDELGKGLQLGVLSAGISCAILAAIYWAMGHVHVS